MDLLTTLVDLSQRLHRSRTLDYNLLSIPCELDQDIRSLTHWFITGKDAERELITSAFNDSHSMTFIVFSERMASLAVRSSSREILVAALVAQIIEGWRFDPRDNVLRLSLVHHSAVKLGIDPNQLFDEASRYASHEISAHLKAFINRKPDKLRIRAMGYKESSDEGGFLYARLS